MLTIIHRRHGDPAEVLELSDSPGPLCPGRSQVLIRVACVAIHPGDLQGIAGAPSFGAPPFIGDKGRIPGFEGVGVIEAVGAGVDAALGLETGQRVAYFPIENGWAEQVLASAEAVAVLPDEVSFEVAAQALINTASAEIIVRAGHDAWPDDKRREVLVLQSGAASAVGRIVTTLLNGYGVRTIRLVRSVASARRLEAEAGSDPVIAMEDAEWTEKLRAAVAGRDIHVALDGVGGNTLPRVAEVLSLGGTIISYGVLGGDATDIRLLIPRGLTIKGVSIAQLSTLSHDLRAACVATAMRLAASRPEIFPVEAVYAPTRIRQAVDHLCRPGRSGAILLDFGGTSI